MKLFKLISPVFLPVMAFLSIAVWPGCHNAAKRADRVTLVRDSAADKAGSGRTASTGSGVIRNTGTGENGEPLDSSMVSLKAAGKQPLEAILAQVWKIDNADGAHFKSLLWDSVADMKQFPRLALFADRRFTENLHYRLRMGTWSVDKDTRELRLSYLGEGPAVLEIAFVSLNGMEVFLDDKDGGRAILQLSAEGVVHRRPDEDPLHPGNNGWRVKPAVKETERQLRQRLKGCVHFYSLFFRDIYLRQQTTEVEYDGLPSCFVWYNGAIGLQTKAGLDRKWVGCFYSEEQALQAYDILESLLGRHELKWPEHPTSWVKQTAEVLAQLAEKLDTK